MTLYGKDAVIGRVKQIFVRHEGGLKKQTGAILKGDAASLAKMVDGAQ